MLNENHVEANVEISLKMTQGTSIMHVTLFLSQVDSLFTCTVCVCTQ